MKSGKEQRQSFDHHEVENNWRDKWFDDNIYKAEDFSQKTKKYILAELPYPSGKSLHVGHMMRYTVPEMYSRFLRMKGYNVLFPMGWDCFGLPAETYAIKTHTTPQKAIAQATQDYKIAMQQMGYAFDWDREINTSDPEYYKWTQWTFMKLWEKGLAELKEMPVWWCEELGVLADEEVLPAKDGNGKVSERGGYPVEKKLFKQWVLKIPEYAERLIADLDTVDYEESVKNAQLNWIGKKEGINIDYSVNGADATITCFTTRPDTNFGATFVVLAPEHPFVQKILNKDISVESATYEEIKTYVDQAASKAELERITDVNTKTGVDTGFTVKNNLNGKDLPIWISDFVLAHFGTGAVVGVPGHDLRDYDFATTFAIPVIRVVVGSDGDASEITSREMVQEEEGTMVNSDFLDGMEIMEAKEKIKDYIEKHGWGKRVTTYSMRDQVFSRQRYWGEPIPLIYKEDGTIEAIPESELPLELPPLEDFLPEKGESPLTKVEDWVNTTDSDGNPATRETDTMPTWAGSNWYFLRYIDPHNSEAPADFEKMKYWLPVDKYFGDAGHTTVHLLYSRFWHKFLFDLGVVPTAEPYMYRMSGGLLLGPDGNKMSKSKGNVVNPGEVLEKYGADAVRMYLAFIGPYDETYPWNEEGLASCYRFVRTFSTLSDKVTDAPASENAEVQKALHKMIKNLTRMMEDLKLNTSVSEIMIFTNLLKKQHTISREVWHLFVRAIAPVTPFVAEELWQQSHGYTEWNAENSVHLQDWPAYDEDLATDDVVELPVQINGVVRETISVNVGASEEDVMKLAKASDNIQKYLEGKEIKKVIYVGGRILNFVV